MTEFKEGDTIRMIYRCGNQEVGKEYVLKNDSGCLWAGTCSCKNYWELVKKKEALVAFKEGDKIRMKSRCSGNIEGAEIILKKGSTTEGRDLWAGACYCYEKWELVQKAPLPQSFKIGDMVECIEPPVYGKGGAGWQRGRIFMVSSVSVNGSDMRQIVWPQDSGGGGVYSDSVRLVTTESPASKFKFQKGMRVRIKPNPDRKKSPIGISWVSSMDRYVGDEFILDTYYPRGGWKHDRWSWDETWLELVDGTPTVSTATIKGAKLTGEGVITGKIIKTMATKFYKVIKDTPVWDAGAVITDGGGGSYAAVDELYNRDVKSGYESLPSYVVEAKCNAEFFQRVYAVESKMTDTKYLSKEDAKAAREAK